MGGWPLQHRTAAPGVRDAAAGGAVPTRRHCGPEPSWSAADPGVSRWSVVQPSAAIVRLPGVQRWVDQRGLISLGGFRYRVPIVLAGEPVEAVAAEHLVRIFHRDVLVAEHVQRRKPDTGDPQLEVRLRQGSRRPRRPTDGLVVTRVVDSSGYVSFAGTNYRVGNSLARPQCAGVHRRRLGPAGIDGQIVRVHPIRHDRAKEHGAFATPNGRPRKPTGCAGRCGVKAKPLRGRPAGRALTPTPNRRTGSGAEPPDPKNEVDCQGGTGTNSSSGYRNLTKLQPARSCEGRQATRRTHRTQSKGRQAAPVPTTRAASQRAVRARPIAHLSRQIAALRT